MVTESHRQPRRARASSTIPLRSSICTTIPQFSTCTGLHLSSFPLLEQAHLTTVAWDTPIHTARSPLLQRRLGPPQTLTVQLPNLKLVFWDTPIHTAQTELEDLRAWHPTFRPAQPPCATFPCYLQQFAVEGFASFWPSSMALLLASHVLTGYLAMPGNSFSSITCVIGKPVDVPKVLGR